MKRKTRHAAGIPAPDGTLLANDHFPDMKGPADCVHARGLKIGIYTSPGPLTCRDVTGSYQHEKADAK